MIQHEGFSLRLATEIMRGAAPMSIPTSTPSGIDAIAIVNNSQVIAPEARDPRDPVQIVEAIRSRQVSIHQYNVIYSYVSSRRV